MGQLMTSKEAVRGLRSRLKAEVEALRERGVEPVLGVLSLELTPDSESYLRSISRQASRLGVEVMHVESSLGGFERDLEELQERAHGVLVMNPLPGELMERVRRRLSPELDVECVTYENLGLLMAGKPRFIPATPLGVLRLLEAWDVEVRGRRAVVVGRSLTVGRPLALALLMRDATVTVCHSRTVNLAEITRQAEVLVVAVGRPGLIGREHIREGAVVVDVGVNVVNGELVGDVKTEEALEVARLVSPVKGGVGPLTALALLENLLKAIKLRWERRP